MATPEPPPNLASLSIRRILHSHPRERLQVHPLLWTSRHLHLLRCDFVEALPGPLSPPQSPSTSPAQRPPLSDKSLNSAGNLPKHQSNKANHENTVPSPHRLPSPPQQQTVPPASKHEQWARTLARSHLLTMKESALTKLLPTPLFNARSTSDHTILSFESKRIRLPCLTLAANTSTTPGCIAYLDASSLRAARSRFLKQSCGHWNRITRSIYTARLAALTPAQGAHDPYIAAIIIAAAQHHRQRSASHGMASIQVHVILSDDHDTPQLLLYMANVSPSFLDKFTHTRRRPLPSAACQVYTRAIPYQPFESFQQRFHEALLPPPPGSGADRDSVDMETDGHTIRKRGRLDQDEDDIDEEDGGASRKRARVRRE
ncbi:hypothetical protein HER10_EVM0010467 [Colletotrichum scovillei]|uniref:uncharacterized protein n=1 Tax=Colletotrichum scovillei TaxID=1209932 RepID=UPI0015C35925|nr:uncharacterized protein HER10_EVM0010467 [Colletotrichum scovillei]KAF4772825.1 hypothetical protein HER10_EVM0010467 [Colletotrichum scovillei]KAG7038259.1 hypothetical protein JMJ78_0008154 [Colletotrichum scovillei]